MIQVQRKLEGKLAECCICRRQPHHYEIRGKRTHFLECSPCRMRTAIFPTLQQAVEAWETQNTHSWQEAV